MLWLNCGQKSDGLYLVLSLRFTSLVVELDALVMVLPKGLGENLSWFICLIVDYRSLPPVFL